MKIKSPLKDLTLIQIIDRFPDDETARKHLEAVLWKDGPVCPHCKNHKDKPIYKLEPRGDSKAAVRAGVYKCGACLKQFTVTVGTIFEDSHIPLRKWLIAWYLLCSSKKGISSLQLKRILEIGSYGTALFMTHRIRFALQQTHFAEKLSGTIEADEAVVGGVYSQAKGTKNENKTIVMALVQRGGPVRSMVMPTVNGKNLKQAIRDNVMICSEVHTDKWSGYTGLEPKYTHKTVNHSLDEFSRHEGEKLVSTCAVESYFGLLKRGVMGTFHHISPQHLPLYLAEFDHRHNYRKLTDGERTDIGLTKAVGKRLVLKTA
jgi:transposase-like protein